MFNEQEYLLHKCKDTEPRAQIPSPRQKSRRNYTATYACGSSIDGQGKQADSLRHPEIYLNHSSSLKLWNVSSWPPSESGSSLSFPVAFRSKTISKRILSIEPCHSAVSVREGVPAKSSCSPKLWEGPSSLLDSCI